MVRIKSFHCRGLCAIPGGGSEIPIALRYRPPKKLINKGKIIFIALSGLLLSLPHILLMLSSRKVMFLEKRNNPAFLSYLNTQINAAELETRSSVLSLSLRCPSEACSYSGTGQCWQAHCLAGRERGESRAAVLSWLYFRGRGVGTRRIAPYCRAPWWEQVSFPWGCLISWYWWQLSRSRTSEIVVNSFILRVPEGSKSWWKFLKCKEQNKFFL